MQFNAGAGATMEWAMDDDALITWVGDEYPAPIDAIARRIASAPSDATIPVEQGWWPLLVRLDQQLALFAEDYRISRITVDSGRLRFSLKRPLPKRAKVAIRDALREAEAEAARTCEYCGGPGVRRDQAGFGLMVLCDEDAGGWPIPRD